MPAKILIQKFSFLTILVAILFYSCNENNKENIPVLDTRTLRKFDNAKEVLTSWSDKNTVVTHYITEPDNLHPTNGNSSTRSEILKFVHRTLLYIDYSNQEIVPGIVKSMPSISSDGLKYAYQLRENIKWDDGSQLTSEDIVFSAKAFKCPLTNNPSIKFYWDNIDDIIIDPADKTMFIVMFKRKHIQNTSFFTSFSILQRAFHDPDNALFSYSLLQFGDSNFIADEIPALKKWADEFNSDKYGRDPVKINGLGMYKITEWTPGQQLSLTRKTNHWSQASTNYHELSYPKKIIFKLNKDEASQVLEFRSQVMDVSCNLSVGAFLQLNEDEETEKNFNMAMMPTFNYTYICFNTRPDGEKRKKLFDDANLRRALAMLTPVESIIKMVYKQYSMQSVRVVSNVSPIKKEFNDKLKSIAFDIRTAENILLNAGWKDSDNDGILDKMIDGKKIILEAELNYLSSSQEWKAIALLIMEYYAKAGIKLVPVSMEFKLFIERARAHDFDLMLGSWSGTGLAEDFTQLWHTSSWENHGSNYAGFGNNYSDALIDSIKFEMDDGRRNELSHKLQTEIYNQQPYIFLYASLRRNVIHKRFANQMIFSERPGVLENMLRLMSINNGITLEDNAAP